MNIKTWQHANRTKPLTKINNVNMDKMTQNKSLLLKQISTMQLKYIKIIDEDHSSA